MRILLISYLFIAFLSAGQAGANENSANHPLLQPNYSLNFIFKPPRQPFVLSPLIRNPQQVKPKIQKRKSNLKKNLPNKQVKHHTATVRNTRMQKISSISDLHLLKKQRWSQIRSSTSTVQLNKIFWQQEKYSELNLKCYAEIKNQLLPVHCYLLIKLAQQLNWISFQKSQKLINQVTKICRDLPPHAALAEPFKGSKKNLQTIPTSCLKKIVNFTEVQDYKNQ